jgi:fatty acid desaturase
MADARRRIFKTSACDAAPAALTLAHFILVLAFFLAWPHLRWPGKIGLGLFYALSVGWSLNSVAHNFIHNPFFASRRANRAVSLLLSWSLISPQTMYRYIHLQHHIGNADRPNADGVTIDPLSIYQHGEGGSPEPILCYVFLQFFRDDDPFALARKIAVKRPAEARQAMVEFWSLVAIWGAMALIHWPFATMMIGFSYLGQCLSNLSGYYEHFGADPDRPIAWGVSSYGRLYNALFLNNGYHAEHHYRPKAHWTLMAALHRQIAVEQARAGVVVIGAPHMLGFLDRRTWRIESAQRRPRKLTESTL